jgi:predicted permease
MLIIILEIIIVGMLARRLGSEAHDKGFSNILFMILASFLWIGSRITGNVIGQLIFHHSLGSLVIGWLAAIIAYIIFYYIISKIKDKPLFDEDNSWEKQNAINPETEEKSEGK